MDPVTETQAERGGAGLAVRLLNEVRERPQGYAVLALFMVAGPFVAGALFPDASAGVTLIGGLAFGAYATLCAIPEKFY